MQRNMFDKESMFDKEASELDVTRSCINITQTVKGILQNREERRAVLPVTAHTHISSGLLLMSLEIPIGILLTMSSE